MKQIRLAFFAILLSVVMLTGCFEEFADGYQFGDVSALTARELKDLKQASDTYCDKNADSLLRKTALTLIKAQFPLVPANGICG